MLAEWIDYDDWTGAPEPEVKFIDIDIEVKEKRNSCLLVETRKKAVWLPVSRVVVESIKGSMYTLIMPAWFAESKGLI